MASLRRIIAEVHRRSLWQVLSIYLIGAWIAYQVILGLTDGIGLPDWVPGFAFVLFLIGLPIVLATAFVNEGAPTLRRAEPAARDWDETLLPGLDRAGGAAEPAPVGDQSAAPPWLSWRRSVGAGALAFLALGLGTTGFMGMRVFGIGPAGTLVARQVLDEADQVLLADFSSTGDSGLGNVVSEALRIDLMQTTIIRLVDPAEVREGLRMMQRDAADGLPEPAALQLAQRQGYRAVLAGDVSMLGGTYIVSARILSAADGAVVAAFREVARDSTRLIDAVDGLAKQIRAKAGESLRSVRASEPLWKVSTSSLSALRKYTEAEKILHTSGDALRAVQLLEEAVAEDPEFASAHRKIGTILGNFGIRPSDRRAAITRAWELRDRLPDRERLYAIGTYHSSVTGDDAAAADAYRAVLDRHPDDAVAINNLAVSLNRLGRYQETATALLDAVRRPQVSSSEFTNLLTALSNLGRTDEVRETVALAVERLPDNANVQSMAAQVPLLDGDFAEAEARLRRIVDSAPAGSSRWFLSVLGMQDILSATGQLRELDRLAVQAADAARANGMGGEAFMADLTLAWIDLAERGDTARGLRRVRDVLARTPLEEIPVTDRPYLMLASMYGWAGDFGAAHSMVAAYEREVPLEARYGGSGLALTRAWLDMREAPSPERIETYAAVRTGNLCPICRLPEIGLAWERVGRTDAALAAYQEYIDTPYFWRLSTDGAYRSTVLLRLGELHAERGDRERAAAYYGQLLDLWRRADPEYQPRIQSVNSRLRALSGPG
jgi:eukaryotic-like serine/threonine-protein kinase